MQLFNNLEGKHLFRKAKIVNGEKKVKIYLQKFKCLPISNLELKSIDNKKYTLDEFEKNLKTV